MSGGLRQDHDRWFKVGSGLSLVPAGALPEEAGVDSRMACEVPAPPSDYARWVGQRRGWVVTARGRMRDEAAEQSRRGIELGVGGLLRRIEDLEARLAAYESSSG